MRFPSIIIIIINKTVVLSSAKIIKLIIKGR